MESPALFWGIILLLVIALFLWPSKKKNEMKIRKGAAEIKDTINKTFAMRHEYRLVSPKDFQRLNLFFYERTSEVLTSAGLHFLGDVEDVTLSEAHPNNSTFVRFFMGEDYDICASIYHMRPKGYYSLFLTLLGGTGSLKIIDMESLLSDGTVLATTNAPKEFALSSPPEILSEHLPKNAAALWVYGKQQKRITAYLEAHPGVTVATFKTMEEVLEFQNLINGYQARHRMGIKTGVTREEMDRVAGKSFKKAGEAAYKELEKKAEEDDNL